MDGMSETPIPPTERECELCGRCDSWDETVGHWRIADAGRVHCVHEWDINGRYNPFTQQ
jgi:hypothetical protein